MSLRRLRGAESPGTGRSDIQGEMDSGGKLPQGDAILAFSGSLYFEGGRETSSVVRWAYIPYCGSGQVTGERLRVVI